MGQLEAFISYYEGLLREDGGIGEKSWEFLQRWVDSYIARVKLFCQR